MRNNNNLMTLDFASPLGSLEAYISWVNRLSLLNEEDELRLANEYHLYGDLNSARQLVMANLRYVVRIANSYHGYGLPLGDLIQEGNIGLMKAVKRFDPKQGVRLITFAVHWIKAEINEFVIKNWRIVKIATTKAQRKLFFNLRKHTKRLGWFNQKDLNEIAHELNVKPEDVKTMEGRLLNGNDVSFQSYATDGEEDNSFSPEDYLTTEGDNPAEIMLKNDWEDTRIDKLRLALEKLDARSQDILNLRWMQEPKATLQDLADKYNVSCERIRQIEQQAMNKIKKFMS